MLFPDNLSASSKGTRTNTHKIPRLKQKYTKMLNLILKTQKN